MALLFPYDERKDTITVSMTEQRENSGVREIFTEVYKRIPEPEWVGTYRSEAEQTIKVKQIEDGRLEITYHGYSEEGWYTDTFELEFCDGQLDQAVREAVVGVTEAEYYTLTDE